MNKVFLIGNLTKDPEAINMANGKQMARMSIAINNKNGADFFDIAVFDSTAQLCLQWLNKGRKIAITGYLKTHKYEKNGATITATQIIASEVEFLDRAEKQEPVKAPEKKTEKPKVVEVEVENLPF